MHTKSKPFTLNGYFVSVQKYDLSTDLILILLLAKLQELAHKDKIHDGSKARRARS